jgi:Spy/CpxP family protein refolding chaperone
MLVGAGVAQEKPTGRLPPGFAKLGLSDEQKQKIYKIQAEYQSKIQALRAQIKKLEEEERTQIFSVLTPGQKELYRKLRDIPETKSSDKPEK